MPTERAQAAIDRARKKLRDAIKNLEQARRQAKPLPVEDFPLVQTNGRKTSLARLFGRHEKLILVHHMGPQCPYCSLWSDGYNGQLEFIRKKAAFAACSPVEPKLLARALKTRGWNFPFLHDPDGALAKAMGFWGDAKDAWPGPHPGVSVFAKADAGIVRIADEEFFPGDIFCPAFSLLGLLGDA